MERKRNYANRKSYSATDGCSSTSRSFEAGEAYAAAVALEDTREEARERERARVHALNEPTIMEGPLIGWRWWHGDLTACLLKSPYRNTVWHPGVPLFAPRIDGDWGFGIHAYKLKRHAFTSKGIYIVGSVRLWGTIIEHELGYRAEFAEVNSIDHVSMWAFTGDLGWPFQALIWRQRLRKRYGV